MSSSAKKFDFEELLRVAITATVLVIGSRFLLNNTYLSTWLGQAWLRGQQQIAILRGASPASIPVGTPATILKANDSVVMLQGRQSIGSGVILTSDGLVLTNSHVVRAGGQQWKVRLSDGREFSAHIVGVGDRKRGIYYDLALVQLEGASGLPVARFSEGQPPINDPVWAIGAPYGKPEVITQGTFKRMTSDGILLSSTEVHPGNSGGPLLNRNGEVIGINTEINPNLPDNATTASISVSLLQEHLPQLVN